MNIDPVVRAPDIAVNTNQIIIATIAAFCLFLSTTKIDFFTGLKINYLPLQIVLSLISVSLITKTKKIRLGYLLLFLFGFFVLGLRNMQQPESIITNPLIPSLGVMTLVAALDLKIRGLRLTKLTLLIFCSVVISLQIFQNFSFNPVETLNGRFKGLGSGTLYSLVAGFVALHLIELYKRSAINGIQLLTLIIIPIWTLLLTQSRGVFLSVLIIVLFPFLRSLRGQAGVIGLLIPATIYVVYFTPLVEFVGLLSRLDFTSYADVAEVTSGRFHTQATIVQTMLASTSLDSFFFGPDQLNGIKTLVHAGLEFPHFDLLYVAYDSGLIGLMSYFILAATILKKYWDSPYIYLFFLSTLHTNMIISPMFLVLAWLMSENRKSNRC